MLHSSMTNFLVGVFPSGPLQFEVEVGKVLQGIEGTVLRDAVGFGLTFSALFFQSS